ncbi:PhoX family protein [Paenibacillus chungangensis]|uniref:PhoX family protein n=1 Tax=Paenibacillus chungangensis TaxID=696535 RepID=A0ABW3HRW4_9BACL
MNENRNQQSISRRKFLAYLGSTAATAAIASSGLSPLVESAAASGSASSAAVKPIAFPQLAPQKTNRLTVASGYMTSPITSSSLLSNANYIRQVEYGQGNLENTGVLWACGQTVAHEAPLSGSGSLLIDIQRRHKGLWTKSGSFRELNANSRLAFTGPVRNARSLNGASIAQGVWSNGYGGKTPWGTMLAGESLYNKGAHKAGINPQSYGWTAEIHSNDTGITANKHTALGRFSHGSMNVAIAASGHAVVYMTGEQVFFKYISRGTYDPAAGVGNSRLLEDGKLYAADLSNGQWLELSVEPIRRILSNPSYRMPAGVQRLREELLDMLKEQADVLAYAEESALVLGATLLEHARGVALHPGDHSVFLSQTGNDRAGHGHGSIIRMVEQNNDAATTDFQSDQIVTGGLRSAISSPGPLAFDPFGRLWVATDIAAEQLHQGAYAPFGNNALYMLTPSGDAFDKAQAFAYAPGSAVLSAPAFAPDGSIFAAVCSLEHPEHNAVIAITKA